MKKLTDKIKSLNIDLLKEVAIGLMDSNSFKDGSNRVFEIVMNELESRMPESEFILFCDEM